jgi:hypothetical protein
MITPAEMLSREFLGERGEESVKSYKGLAKQAKHL